MSPSTAPSDPANPYRLPRNVVPRRYDLRLEPDLADASFTGGCVTTIEVLEPTHVIECNAVDLDVHDVWVVDDATGDRIAADTVALDPDTERLRIELAAIAEPGTFYLHTYFRGELNDKLCGFYRSTFTDADGEEQVLATTQMEATDCRRAFPCWDEPDLKAVFAVTLVVPDGLLALSNAAEIDREADDADPTKVVVRFADTPVMSTYLVAFVVGPLEISDPVEAAGVPLRVAYPKGRGHLSAFALEIGKFALEFLTDYYGVPYPGDKLDLVAIPDFAFGAMENLGCVTFRETALLVDPAAVPQAELQRVTDVVAHELAHMWFGDLVTMKWWNGIWLNEAFATFMEMLATDAFRPDWDRWTDFGLSRTAAFDVDALASTRPVEYEVVSPADAEGMFDILTYEKGAAVVRMLEQFLGADVFRLGIAEYLRRHAFGNTETIDLWDALESQSGEPVRDLMVGWIFQGGFPSVHAELVRDDVHAPEGEAVLRLTQQRFRYQGGESTEPASWLVPVLATVCSRPEPHAEPVTVVERILLDADGAELPLLGQVDWVLCNTEGTGFYRCSYAPELLEALVTHAQGSLSPIERYGLVDDAAASLLAGGIGAPELLTFLERFGEETDVSVWQRIIGALGFLDRIVDGEGLYGPRPALQERVRLLLGGAYDRLGDTAAPGESDRTRERRGVLLEALAVLGNDSRAIDRCRAVFAAAGSGGDVDPSLVAASVWAVAAVGGPDDFEEYLRRMKGATSPQDEVRYLQGLADFPDPALFARALEMSLTDAVRTQNAPYFLRRCLSNRDLGAQAWDFVEQRWDEINTRFPSNSIVRMLEGIRSLHHPDTAARVRAFFAEHEVPQGAKTLAQHLERLEVNAATRAREAGRLAHALR